MAAEARKLPVPKRSEDSKRPQTLAQKKMIDAAQKVIVLADASKFGKKSFAKICGLSEIDEIITDKEISKTFRKKLLENEVKVTVVGR